MKKSGLYAVTAFSLVVAACGGKTTTETPAGEKSSARAEKFLEGYSKEYQALYLASSEAEWRSNTMIVEGDSSNSVATRKANEAYASFTGSKENIDSAQALLKLPDLSDLQKRQLEYVLLNAGGNPATVPDLVKAKIKADAAQNERLFGFAYKLNGKKVSTNDLDEILRTEKNLAKRQAAWESSKEVGKVLKDGLVELRGLRNQTVQALNYNDYFSYQVSEYGMTTDEMVAEMRQLVKEVWPMYRELHTYARYELAAQYGVKEVPEYLPAHWVPNRWGQDWSSMVEVEGIDLDSVLKDKGPEWLLKTAESFYVSLGFEALPASFWEKSSLYPVPDSASYSKNNHASAWHVDLDHDVRCLMSVVPNTEWYETTHHELGHIYYYLTYTNKDVPLLLRAGANRGYHEAMGSLLGLAAMQKPYMEHLNLLPKGVKTDDTKVLLKEALNYIVFLPFGAGVMTEFEHDLYKGNLPADQLNARWWELTKKYQGMVPPTERGEEYCDAASKTHINNDAAQYYDYAMSYVLLFQFHDHISKKILKQDPHATNYFGNKEVGKFLKDVMYPGASRDWRELLKSSVGAELSAQPMLDYFMPLMDFLKKANEGRVHTLPEAFE